MICKSLHFILIYVLLQHPNFSGIRVCSFEDITAYLHCQVRVIFKRKTVFELRSSRATTACGCSAERGDQHVAIFYFFFLNCRSSRSPSPWCIFTGKPSDSHSIQWEAPGACRRRKMASPRTITIVALSFALGLFFVFMGTIKLTPRLSKDAYSEMVSPSQ